MARRAMRNRRFIGYTLGPLERNFTTLIKERPFDFEGGGVSNFVWTDNLFSAWARSENLFSCKHGKPQSRQQFHVLETVKAVV